MVMSRLSFWFSRVLHTFYEATFIQLPLHCLDLDSVALASWGRLERDDSKGLAFNTSSSGVHASVSASYYCNHQYPGFPGGSDRKRICLQGRPRFNYWTGKTSREKGSTHLPENLHGYRACGLGSHSFAITSGLHTSPHTVLQVRSNTSSPSD